MRDKLTGGPVEAAEIDGMVEKGKLFAASVDKAESALGVVAVRLNRGRGAVVHWALPKQAQALETSSRDPGRTPARGLGRLKVFKSDPERYADRAASEPLSAHEIPAHPRAPAHRIATAQILQTEGAFAMTEVTVRWNGEIFAQCSGESAEFAALAAEYPDLFVGELAELAAQANEQSPWRFPGNS